MTDNPLPLLKFTGAIPANYDHYLGPMFFEDYAAEVASRIDGSSVRLALELSCGTGRVTNHLWKALPVSATLVASDLSPDMLRIAREKLSKFPINWQIIDANQIPFEDNRFDLVVCCFGYMFVENKVNAFAEALRVLRPGGMLLFSTWDELEFNGASRVFRNIVKKYFGDLLPSTYKLPFSMHDASVIREQLRLAGFSKTTVDVVTKDSVAASAKEAAFGLVRGGSLYNEIIRRNPEWLEQIETDVENELTEKYSAAPMIAPMRALIAQAWK